MCCETALRDLIRTGEAGRLRQASGISQRTLGAALGVSSAMVSYMEDRRRSVPWRLAPSYYRVLRGLANHDAVSRELTARQRVA